MSAASRRSEAVRKQFADVSAARGAYEARWSLRRLQTVDPDLHRRLVEQVDIFDRTLFHADDADEITTHGEATCRGWAAAIAAMERTGEADDAYMIGCDPRSGVKVAIGDAARGPDRVGELHGDSVTWLTPDEVATLYAATEGFKAIDAIKRRAPGAELIDRRPADPAKWDSGLGRGGSAEDAA